MSTNTYQSSYLARHKSPLTSLRRAYKLVSYRTVTGPRVTYVHPRAVAGAASWVLLIALGYGALRPGQLPDLAKLDVSNAPAAKLASTTLPQMLPAGPTGLLLPPGTLAPAYSFLNGYANGQCTWYVAGRRQVPGDWGNAISWYRNAHAAGWSEGTIPAIGAIAWTSQGPYGHVALVEAIDGNQVQISEMNYLGRGKIDKRWVTPDAFKYIY